MSETTTFGDVDTAKMVYDFHLKGMLPDGWTYPERSGTYREVYICPSKKYVYKVARDRHYALNANQEELANYRRICEANASVPGWRVAHVEGISIKHDNQEILINVMEYIDGSHEGDDDDDIAFDDESIFNDFGLYDAHSGNYVRSTTGEKVIIDMST